MYSKFYWWSKNAKGKLTAVTIVLLRQVIVGSRSGVHCHQRKSKNTALNKNCSKAEWKDILFWVLVLIREMSAECRDTKHEQNST